MKKVALLILDGWGHGDKTKSDAIFNAKTPFVDNLESKYPSAELLTHAENVGLPEGQMGNSEVGHMNIGAGRIVFQELSRINNAIKDNSISENKRLNELFDYCLNNSKPLHLMGLVSKGGVHSSQEHLYKIVELAHIKGVKEIYIHAFTDGRDCDPKSGLGYLNELENEISNTNARVVSIIGRYYAMDRDKRWERVRKAYDLLVNGVGENFNSISAAINTSYTNDVTDEFIEPITIGEVVKIKEDDGVLCFNFRTDRCREITQVLTQENLPSFNMKTIPLHYVTMTQYDKNYKNVGVVFTNDNLKNTLGEVVSSNGLKQIRIAETEKYPHVTFFFSGGKEDEFEGEKRLLVNSPKVATYDLQPEMSAPEVTSSIVKEINAQSADFICLNFANPDMVGHTGVYNAIVKAVETVDDSVKQVVEAGLANDYSFVIIADHGNADNAVNPDGSPNTAHSLNPVPIIVVDKDIQSVKDGILADVAPTILKMMGVSQPKEMTGVSLV